MIRKIIVAILNLSLCILSSNGQEYHLVWEDNFNGTSLDSSIWNIENREGIWNTGGNSELQHYKKENVTIGDDGIGNNCLIITAKKEDYKGYGYTSGRVNTKSKFSFRFGKVEARIKVPNLANGLWPAFWTLGYKGIGWPDCGEIDIMEMGHSSGISDGTQNSFVGSHLHWGPFPSDYGTVYTSIDKLNEDYHLYQLEWTDSDIKICIDDYQYFSMDISGESTEEFRDYAHYFLFNLAVGGSLTGITNPSDITATLPANLYIDYIKVYQKVEYGDLIDSANVMSGNFGIYEETVPVTISMEQGFDASTIVSGMSERNGETPIEGDEVLSYDVIGGNSFELDIRSEVKRNMVKYSEGSVQFWIKTESPDTIWVGIADINGNEDYISLHDGSEANPLRNGQWQLCWIQLADLSDSVDLENMQGMFKIKGNFKEEAYISVDRVVWYESPYQNITTNYFGIYAEHEGIKAKLDFNSGGNIYFWNGFSQNNSASPFYGEDVLAFNANTGTWNGFGIHSDTPLDLSSYINGALYFSYKTGGSQDIEIGLKNSSDEGVKYIYSGSSTIIRDYQWHTYSLPLKDFIPDAGKMSVTNLKDIVIPFYMVGALDVELDEIYLSKDGTALKYPDITTSIKGRTDRNEIRVFPNPANDFIYIDGIIGRSDIQIFDKIGRLTWIGTICEQDQINLTSFSKGYYLLKIYNEGNFRIAGFVIK